MNDTNESDWNSLDIKDDNVLSKLQGYTTISGNHRDEDSILTLEQKLKDVEKNTQHEMRSLRSSLTKQKWLFFILQILLLIIILGLYNINATDIHQIYGEIIKIRIDESNTG
jgi:hypothetical protein